MLTRVLITSVSFLFLISCSHKMIPEITEEEMKSHISYLASEELEGRYPGTRGDSLTLAYIEKEFKDIGLKRFNDSYLQKFEFLSGINPSVDNKLVFDDQQFIQDKDFYPMSFSSEGTVDASIVYCGYGFEIKTDEIQRNDYSSIDPKGKWALILRGEPEENNALMERSGDRDKAMLAMEKGAVGVLLVSGTGFSISDDLDTSLERKPELGIPVVQITRDLANQILGSQGKGIEELEELSIEHTNIVVSIDKKLNADIELKKAYTTTANVIAQLENKKNDKWIVVGAHHDHLGTGGPGSSSRAPDTIAVHNGADDNASGVSTVLELAEYFSASGKRPSSNMIFVSFGAEEKGILGSRYFVENPPVPKEDISLMINIDMLGRMKEDSSLQIGGVGTSEASREIIKAVNNHYNLHLSLSEAGFGPSDHASFYAADIPVLFFSTGAHSDYHTPYDDPDSLNYEGLVLGTRYIAGVIEEVDNMKTPMVFREAGPKRNTSRSFRDMVTLGIMPDVSGDGNEGMKVLAVTDGKPADLGGMKKGDVITAIEGKKVENVYDYMYRLKQLKVGQQIVVSVKRNKELIDLLIQL